MMDGPGGADFYRLLCYRRRCTTPMFQLRVLCEHCVAARQYSVIGKQLLLSNDRNKVLGLSEDGTCTDLFGNLRVNSLKRDLSNNTTVKPPLFSLVNRVPLIKIPSSECEWFLRPGFAGR
jgi:hypothetical protein